MREKDLSAEQQYWIEKLIAEKEKQKEKCNWQRIVLKVASYYSVKTNIFLKLETRLRKHRLRVKMWIKHMIISLNQSQSEETTRLQKLFQLHKTENTYLKIPCTRIYSNITKPISKHKWQWSSRKK